MMLRSHPGGVACGVLMCVAAAASVSSAPTLPRSRELHAIEQLVVDALEKVFSVSEECTHALVSPTPMQAPTLCPRSAIVLHACPHAGHDFTLNDAIGLRADHSVSSLCVGGTFPSAPILYFWGAF